MTKPEKLSDNALAAKTTAELWGLFFTDNMLDKLVMYTNDKIQETLDKKQYTPAQRRKNTHLKTVDKVHISFLFLTGIKKKNYSKFFFAISFRSVDNFKLKETCGGT
jgi:hypothetical protein